MTDAKVFDSIKSLLPKEKEEFDLFLMSPYFQKRFTTLELRQFYAMILAAVADPANTEVDKETAHKLLFPDKPYTESRLDQLMFELNRLVKVFLLTKHYHRPENEVQQLVDWSVIQRKSNAGFAFDTHFQKIRKEFSKGIKDSAESFIDRYYVSKEAHEWELIHYKSKGDLGIPEVIQNLEGFFFISRLELLNRFLLQQKAAFIETPETIQRALAQSYIPEFYLDQSPALMIAAKIHELFCMETPEPQGFQELHSLLKQFESQLSQDTLFQCYAYLRNYCTILIDAGNDAFASILHEIQRDNLKRGYFYAEGKISPNSMFNITQHAIRGGNLAWAWEFIEFHKDKIIGENETQDFFRLNKAICLFAEKKFEEALDNIPFNPAHASYYLMARRLELKIYYETDSDLLSSKIDAFKMFVSRGGNKHFSPNVFKLYSNFGNFTHQLSQSIQGDKKRSELLTGRIKAKKYVADRSWLLEKALALGEGSKK